jgi:hypothetical protein
MDTHNNLNTIYNELNEDKTKILNYIKTLNLSVKVGYYPFNSFKDGESFFVEQYPIPVITIENKIDVGIDVHQVFFEIKLERETAINFNYHVLSEYQFEVYGVKEYLNDFFDGNIDEIYRNIINSNEKEIGVSINIKKDKLLDTTKQVIEILRTVCKI